MKVKNFSKFFKLLGVMDWAYRLFICLTILMFLTQSISCTEVVTNFKTSGVVVFNNSTYSIEVWTKPEGLGVKISAGSSYVFNEAPVLFEFKKYGKWISIGALISSINIQKELLMKEIRRIPANNYIKIVITGNWRTPWGWDVSLANKLYIQEVLATVPASGDPWDVFAEIKIKRGKCSALELVQYFNLNNPMELSRYVIGLGTKYSDEELKERSEGLLTTWGSEDVFAKRVKAIVMRAKDILEFEESNFGDVILEYKKFLLKSRDQWGKQLLCEMFKQNKPMECTGCLNEAGILNQNGATYLDNIVNLMWYFYSIALNRNQDFTEGTFVIEDTNHIIYNSLLNYVKAVNSGVNGTFKDSTATPSKPYGYSRASSHFKFEQEKYQIRHYGIDMVKVGQSILELPTPGKRHILFGKLGEGNKIFIKLEIHGLYGFRSMAGHGISFLVAQFRKIAPTIAGSDDASNYRKERIPRDFINNCGRILNVAAVINDEQLKNIVRDSTFSTTDFKPIVKQYLFGQINIKGMQYLYSLVNGEIILAGLGNACKYLTDDEKKSLSRYLEELEKEYDDIKMRYGREIIITYEDLIEKRICLDICAALELNLAQCSILIG